MDQSGTGFLAQAIHVAALKNNSCWMNQTNDMLSLSDKTIHNPNFVRTISENSEGNNHNE